MIRALFSGILLVALCNLALAQEPNVMPVSGPQIAHAAITILGLVFAMGLALRAFARPVQFENVPTFPRYMTSAQQYRLGKWIFVAVACAFFVLLVYRHKEVAVAASAFEKWLPDVLKDAVKAMREETESYVLVVTGMGALYLYLLTHEAPWNVLLMIRNTIRGCISIPELGRKIVAQIQQSLQVPPQAIAEIASPLLGVSEADFGKGRTTPDRQWAEICYMKWWLESKRETGEDATFFVERSFSYDHLVSEFDQIAPGMLARGVTGAAGIVVGPIANSVKKLHENFARLVACYLIYRNASRELLNQEARTFGIDVSVPPPENPLRYWIVYVIALMGAVYLGVHVSAIIYDWLQNHKLILAQDSDLALSWVMYSLANYGLAIIVILLIRFLGGPQLDRSHLITYCWTFAVAFVVGPFGLTLAVHYFGPDQLRLTPVPQLFFQMLKWGLGPALVSVYISYYLDRQTARDLPDIDHSYTTRLWRLLNCFGFAVITVFLLLPSLLSIPDRGGLWSASKLQFVATGSTFLVAFGLALAAQFALRKSKQVTTAAVIPPAGGLATVG